MTCRPCRAAGRRNAGTSSSSATPRSPSSAISSAWSASPARPSGSRTATSTSSRRRATQFTLARKPLRHQSAMLQNVYDDRYQPRALADHARMATLVERCRLEAPRQRGPAVRSGRASRRRLERAAVSPPRARPRAVGRDPQGSPLPPAPPRHADHRLLFVQHEHAARRPTSSDKPYQDRKRLDAAPLGRRPDPGSRYVKST